MRALSGILSVVMLLVVEARPFLGNSVLQHVPEADKFDTMRYKYEVDVGHPNDPDGVSLRYDVRIHKHVIRLNEIIQIEAVSCHETSLELTLVSTEALQTMDMIQWTEGSPINGAVEWGCKDADNQPTIIMRLLKSVEVLEEQGKIILHTSGKAKIEHFFEDANISFFSKNGEKPKDFHANVNTKRNDVVENEDGSVTFHTSGLDSYIEGQEPQPTADVIPPKHWKVQGGEYKLQGDGDSGQGKFVSITSPAYRAAYQVGDTIQVQWNYAGWLANTNVKVKMKKERWLVWDETILTPSDVQLSQGDTGFTVTVQQAWRGSYRYYFEFSWDCGILSCETSESPFFVVPELKITSPTADSALHPGDVMNITWLNWGLDPNTELTMTVYQDKSFWVDSKLVGSRKVPNDGYEQSTIPADTEAGGFTSYYVELEWNCLIFGQFCDYVYSDHFNIPGTRANSYNYNADTGLAMEPIPMLSVGCGDVLSHCNGGSGASGRRLMADANGAPTYTTPSQRSPPGSLAAKAGLPFGPETLLDKRFNNAPRRGRNSKPLDIDPCAPMDMGTDPGGVTPGGILGELCNLCQIGGQSIDIGFSCSNCWLKYEYTVQRFELIKSGVTIESLVANTQGTAQLNIELMAEIHYRYVFEVDKQIFQIPLYGYSFSVAGISINLGLILSLNFKFSLEFDFTGRLYVQGGVNSQFSALVQYGTQYPGSRLDTGHSFTYQTYSAKPRITIDATLTARVALVPMLRFTFFDILTISISVEPFVQWESRFAYPPFPEIPDAPESTALKKFTTDCTKPHYFEYTLRAGLGSIAVVAAIDINLFGLTRFYKELRREYPLPFANVPLISGCFLAPKSVATTEVVVDGVANVTTDSDMHTYQYQVQQAAADAAGVDQNRVNLGEITTDEDAGTTTINVGFSSTLDNSEGNSDPAVTNSFGPPRGAFNLAADRLAQRGLYAVGSEGKGGFRLEVDGSTGMGPPPVPNTNFEGAPDTRSADTIANDFKKALTDAANKIRTAGPFKNMKSYTLQQSFNPQDDHSVAAIYNKPPLEPGAFFAGVFFTLGCIALGYAMFWGHRRYKQRHGGYHASSSSGGSNNSSAGRYIQMSNREQEGEPSVSRNENTYSPPVTAPSAASSSSQPYKHSTSSTDRPRPPVRSATTSSNSSGSSSTAPVRPASPGKVTANIARFAAVESGIAPSPTAPVRPNSPPRAPSSPKHSRGASGGAPAGRRPDW